MSYRILSQDCLADNNSHATGLNNNDLIVGPSGAGKTRGYVLPNILQCSESFIVADTKNSLRAETEAVLRQNGYKVLSLDLCGGPSSGYNPLDYIRLDPKTNRHNEQDIMAVSAALIPIETPRDPFWEFSARIYLESIIGYVLESLPEEEHTMDSVVRLSREIGTGRLSKLMDELAVLDPDSFAARRYSIAGTAKRPTVPTPACSCSWRKSWPRWTMRGPGPCSTTRTKSALPGWAGKRPPCFSASAIPTAPWTGWQTCFTPRPCTSSAMKRTTIPPTV